MSVVLSLVFRALPMEKIWIDAHTTTPQTICRWRRRRHVVFFGIDVSFDIPIHVASGLFVSRQMDADRHDGLEAVGPSHVGQMRPVVFAWRVEDQHAEADERVAEENGDGEEDHDKEDVDLLADVAVCEGNGEV